MKSFYQEVVDALDDVHSRVCIAARGLEVDRIEITLKPRAFHGFITTAPAAEFAAGGFDRETQTFKLATRPYTIGRGEP